MSSGVSSSLGSAELFGGMRWKVAVLILAIVFLECLLAFAFLPRQTDTRGSLDTRPISISGGVNSSGENLSEAMLSRDYVEKSLGAYSLSSYDRGSDVITMIEFDLFALVRKEDDAATTQLLAASSARIKDAVETVIRSAEPQDYDDPSLGVIKRKVLRRLNLLLGSDLIREIAIADFRHLQQ